MTQAQEVVLDASALLAALHGESGGEQVERLLEQATISTVNWAEVVQRSLAHTVAVEGLEGDLEALGLTIAPFTMEDAELSAKLWPDTRLFGLSLADRACLALALRLGLPAVTADQAWKGLDVGIRIDLIR